MRKSVKLQALAVLWLGLRGLGSDAGGCSECDASLKDSIDFSNFEDHTPEDSLEHDVLLLQVEMQLQSTRTGAKGLPNFGNAQPLKDEASQVKDDFHPVEVNPSKGALSRLEPEQGARAHVSSASTREQALLLLGGHGHEQAALRQSLVLEGISQLRSEMNGWLGLQVIFGILGLVGLWKFFTASPEAERKETHEQVSEADSNRAKNRALSVCYSVVFIDVFTYGLFAPLIPLLREKFNLTATSIAALLSTFSLAQALATPVLGYLSDVLGRRPIILYALFGETFTYLLCSNAGSFEVLIFCYVLSGIFAGTIGVASATVADVTTKSERPVCMSYVQGSSALGIVLGPTFGAFLTGLGFNYSNTLRACALLCWLNFLYAWHSFGDTRGIKRESDKSEDTESKSSTIPPLAWVLFIASFFGETNTANWESCGALYINETFFPHDASGSTRFFGLLMMINGCVVVLTAVAIFPAVHHHAGQLGSFLIGAVLTVSAKIVGPFTGSKVLFELLCNITVVGDNLTIPSCVALLTELAPHSTGACLGMNATFSAACRIIMPLMFANLYEDVSHGTPFWVVAGCTAFASLLWLWAYHQHRSAEVLKPMESQPHANTDAVDVNSTPEAAKSSEGQK
eukprot:TRINITY_DN12538_c0_g1_i1.p1 TRINITY_DN12538_c0_g1~~TRINITY_DN12538_c0_g1_i1.p1  ORF type:complete len:676 (+),score=77.09 TRINITY_DN12538_c0_g1_i1:146-2029(+)